MRGMFRNMTLIEALLLAAIAAAVLVGAIKGVQRDPKPVPNNQIIIVPDDEGGGRYGLVAHMMLAQFDARGFADAVAAKVEAEGKGATMRALRRTGIPTATFDRMLHGSAPRNIDTIISAAAHFGLSLVDFVKVRP